MIVHGLVIFITTLLVAHQAMAEEGAILAAKYNCIKCHAMASKSIGPTFQDIAVKYQSAKDAQAVLEMKVRKGGAGAWGKMPMPATVKSVSDEEIKAMVQWMLSLKAGGK